MSRNAEVDKIGEVGITVSSQVASLMVDKTEDVVRKRKGSVGLQGTDYWGGKKTCPDERYGCIMQTPDRGRERHNERVVVYSVFHKSIRDLEAWPCSSKPTYKRKKHANG
jgi:hypothetical protein